MEKVEAMGSIKYIIKCQRLGTVFDAGTQKRIL